MLVGKTVIKGTFALSSNFNVCVAGRTAFPLGMGAWEKVRPCALSSSGIYLDGLCWMWSCDGRRVKGFDRPYQRWGGQTN